MWNFLAVCLMYLHEYAFFCFVVSTFSSLTNLPYLVKFVRRASKHSVFVVWIYRMCLTLSNRFSHPVRDLGSQSYSDSLRVH